MIAGDWFDFSTTLHNDGQESTPPLAVHLSIAAIEKGHHVDPEDWSPRRTQYLPALGPGESAQLDWQIHALFAGEFASFITVVSSAGDFAPAMSAPLQLHVMPDDILPLNRVIPIVSIVPLIPLAFLMATGAYNRRKRMLASQ